MLSRRIATKKALSTTLVYVCRKQSTVATGRVGENLNASGGLLVRVRDRITKVKKSEDELTYLQRLRPLCESLVEVKKMPKDHPVVPWAESVRSVIFRELADAQTNDEKIDLALKAINDADIEHNEVAGGYAHTTTFMKSALLANTDQEVIRPMAELELRKLLFKNYLIHIRTTGISNSMASISDAKMIRLVDAFLRGTSSERLVEHLSLYSSPMTNAELQDGFYALFEPEVKLVGDFLQQTAQFSSKKHKKVMKKWLDTYLLDDLELNVKSRCVFVWVGDAWKEIRSQKDDDTEPTGDLLMSRRKYFEEGVGIAKGMCDSYLKKVRLTDFEAQEWRTNVIRGWGFFLGICALDGIVCAL